MMIISAAAMIAARTVMIICIVFFAAILYIPYIFSLKSKIINHLQKSYQHLMTTLRRSGGFSLKPELVSAHLTELAQEYFS